jgi:hypothetical protein
LGRGRGVVGTCDKKPQIMFDIPHILIVVLIFFNKTWDSIAILIHVFSNTEKHRLL